MPGQACMFDAIEKNLNLGADLIGFISDDQFNDKTVPPYHSSIGCHMRHILDIFDCILTGLDAGKVDLTARTRNVKVETDRDVCHEYLEQVLCDSPTGKMIMKPLNGFGGQGVIVIEKTARQNFRSLLDFYIGSGEQSNYVILQEYVTGAHQGDVRILMLNGEPIGAMRRVPSGDDLRSNIHAGGKEVKHHLTKEEKKLCRAIGPQLVRDGLYFVGLDVINGKLIEVNVLSPGGITRINRLNRVKLQAQVIDFVENVVSAKERVLERRSTFRKAIEDAEAI